MVSTLKKDQSKFRFINWYRYVIKGIREGICHAIHQCAKANKKYRKDYDENKGSPYLKYWDVNNLYGHAMWPNVPVDCFKWVEDTSQFNTDFIKENYNGDSDVFFKLMVCILKN